MENYKNKLMRYSKSAMCEIEQEYDYENNEIRFKGKIKINKMTKTNQRIMYGTPKTQTPAVLYFYDKMPLRVTNTETFEIYEEIEKETQQKLI